MTMCWSLAGYLAKVSAELCHSWQKWQTFGCAYQPTKESLWSSRVAGGSQTQKSRNGIATETSVTTGGGRTPNNFNRSDGESRSTDWKLPAMASKSDSKSPNCRNSYAWAFPSRSAKQPPGWSHVSALRYPLSRRELGVTRESPPLTRFRSRM